MVTRPNIIRTIDAMNIKPIMLNVLEVSVETAVRFLGRLIHSLRSHGFRGLAYERRHLCYRAVSIWRNEVRYLSREVETIGLGGPRF